MSDDLKDILSNSERDIEQDKLLQYLNSQLPRDEQHEFEKQMNDDEFINDAVEGLQQLKNKNDIPNHIVQLNSNLVKQLDKKKSRKAKRKLPSQFWTYLTVIILLILSVVAFFIIARMRN